MKIRWYSMSFRSWLVLARTDRNRDERSHDMNPRGEETIAAFGFDLPMDQPDGIEFIAKLANALITRAPPWFARTVDSARRWLRVPAYRRLFASLGRHQRSRVLMPSAHGQ